MEDRTDPPAISGGLRGLTAAVCLLVLFLAPAGLRAQTIWQLTPYTMEVRIALDDSPVFTRRYVEKLTAALQERIDLSVGTLWKAKLVVAEGPERYAMLTQPAMLAQSVSTPDDTLAPGAIDPAKIQADKLFLLTIKSASAGYSVYARELDVYTRQWNSPHIRPAAHAAVLADCCFDSLLAGFAPLAQIATVNATEKTTELEIRGSALASTDPTISVIKVGDAYRSITRTVDTRGGWKSTTETPWTLMVVSNVEGAMPLCKVHSALKTPLTARGRGRRERLGLLATPGETETTVRVASRVDEAVALAGYEVWAYAADNPDTTLLAVTDSNGEFNVPPAASGMRLLLLKNGSEILAKLPIVPGFVDHALATMPDDHDRLAAEGVVLGMQDSLIDRFARQQVLVFRAKSQLEKGQIEQAEGVLKTLRLVADPQLARTIRQRSAEYSSRDKAIQSKIERLFSETQKIASTFIKPELVQEIDQLVQEAKDPSSGGAPGAAAAGANTPPTAGQ